MSTLIGFTVLLMFGLFIYVVREFFYKKRLYMVFALWLEIFAITIGISAFIQNVKSSELAELIYVLCGIIPAAAVAVYENHSYINYHLDLTGKLDRLSNLICTLFKKLQNRIWTGARKEHSIDLDLKPIDTISTDKPEGYITLGDEYVSAGFYEEAIDCYKRYVEIRKNGYEGYIKMGLAYESLGNTDEAIRSYRKSIEASPHSIEAYLYLGSCYSGNKRYSDATELYINAIKINPDEYTLYYHLGIVCEECKKYPEAAKAYEMALEIKPEDEEIIYHLGAVLTELRKYDEAIYTYKSALDVKPSDYELFYNLSVVYSLLKKPEIAIDNLKKAIELNRSVRSSVLYNKAFDNIRSDPEFKKVMG